MNMKYKNYNMILDMVTMKVNVCIGKVSLKVCKDLKQAYKYIDSLESENN